ncbi:ankyrin repeat protein [Pandoravirus inopinatum]|uniref:Ankyrin repeat protein n=1 Tax=Pandoravirus inopinatum TaxID=1605721 RepID=A0A0B5J5V6_9VIRU|nr:ankyrin repeat protein [Pandoravirus inopinatum]AJF97080.1 ankyrin repeat protein [Pandoravirus inopinatum]
MTVASGLGRVDIVDHLWRHGFEWDRQMSVRAVACGHIPLLAYVHDRGGVQPWAYLCRVAAERGQVDMLAWLHEHGHSWSARTCAAAASQGHLDVLVYLYQHGCPWDGQVYRVALAGGHHACVKYARAHGCPDDVDGSAHGAVLLDAAGTGSPQRKRRRRSVAESPHPG